MTDLQAWRYFKEAEYERPETVIQLSSRGKKKKKKKKKLN
jgi:hypothetical protein